MVDRKVEDILGADCEQSIWAYHNKNPPFYEKRVYGSQGFEGGHDDGEDF